MPSQAQSRDQICGLLKTAVDAASLNPNLVIIWDDVEPAKLPEPPTPWVRHKIRHASGGQASLAGADGRCRYRRSGVIIVQLFVEAGKGSGQTDLLVPIILAAYEGKSTAGGHSFTNGRFQEVGKDGPWFQTNIFFDFEYDEVK